MIFLRPVPKKNVLLIRNLMGGKSKRGAVFTAINHTIGRFERSAESCGRRKGVKVADGVVFFINWLALGCLPTERQS